MEYGNLRSQNHQPEESASSLPPIAPCTVVTSSGDYPWSQSFRILNNNGSDLYSSETNPNSRFFPSQATNFKTPEDLTYSFDEARNLMNRQSNSSAKEEASDSFSKLRINLPFEVNKSNLLSSLGLTNSHPSYSHSDPFYFSSGSAQENSSNFGEGFASFGHVYPNNINYSASTRSSSSIMLTTNEGFNSSQVLDLLSPPRANYRSAQSCSPSSQNSSSLGLYRERNMSLGHGDINQEYSSTSNMKSGFFNEVTATRTKRRSPSNLSEPNNKDQSHKNTEAKKSKSILRSSNPPLKVRKEKLGDRISALHRLVAPFGKTDTASVLTEAIGYIHFLHDQVQTLSMPYLKSLQGKLSRKTHQVHGFGKDTETEVKILDLRSRGLCLVPVSCASYISNGFE